MSSSCAAARVRLALPGRSSDDPTYNRTVRKALFLTLDKALEQGIIDLIRNYGPGTRDGASGFDRAAGTVASCSFVVEEFDR